VWPSLTAAFVVPVSTDAIVDRNLRRQPVNRPRIPALVEQIADVRVGVSSYLLERIAGGVIDPGTGQEGSGDCVSTPGQNLTLPPVENLTDRRGDEPQAVATS
jgi:hypothetical protein